MIKVKKEEILDYLNTLLRLIRKNENLQTIIECSEFIKVEDQERLIKNAANDLINYIRTLTVNLKWKIDDEDNNEDKNESSYATIHSQD